MNRSLIFTIGRLHDSRDPRAEPLTIVSGTESGCHLLPDDPAAEGIGHCSLQSVAWLDPDFMILNKDED